MFDSRATAGRLPRRSEMSNRTSILMAAAVAAGLSSAHTALAAPVVDGQLDAGLYTRFATQTVQTGFGDANGVNNGSEVDAAYARLEGGKLYVFVSGNLEANNNHLMFFFDTVAGAGQNVVRSDNSGPDFGALNQKYAGMKFDADFAADYGLWTSHDNGGNGNMYWNFSEMN